MKAIVGDAYGVVFVILLPFIFMNVCVWGIICVHAKPYVKCGLLYVDIGFISRFKSLRIEYLRMISH